MMYESQYYKENKVDEKDDITSGALTAGYIITVICTLLLLIQYIGANLPD